ncbi:MAG: hypothetical protein ACYTJ0_14910 [Planctomycetota bacterium]|jgi:hypothetical protein
MTKRLTALSLPCLLVAAAALAIATPTPALAGGDPPCEGDITGPDGAPDGWVDVQDLLEVIFSWGECEPDTACPADLDGSGTVDVQDLLVVIFNFGPCDPGMGCQSPADCDDGDDCTLDLCIAGTCYNIPLWGCGDGGD